MNLFHANAVVLFCESGNLVTPD